MPKLVEYEENKEYVFVSPLGKLHIFRFSKKNNKRIILVKRTDALSSIGMKKMANIPMEGDFEWPFNLVFGPNGTKFKYVGEL